MIILGIETSADETGIAVVKDGRQILSNVVASSVELQKKYGGIYPEMAARKQVEVIIPVLNEALRVKGEAERIDAIAVTIGPGLIGSLLVGAECAKTLAYVLNKPIIPVNHVLAHVYANWLYGKTPRLPAMCLIVSGGHTQLMLMESHGKFKLLGQTLDDAAGEAFDKTARLLGFPYPGGPEIQKEALKGKPKMFNFPRGMIGSKDYNFSFSGFKTAVLREVTKLGRLTPQNISDLAFEIQEAITDVLVKKTLKAALEFQPKSILVSGGVAANTKLREKFNSQSPIPVHIPPVHLCTDNGAVISSYAYFNNKSVDWKVIQAFSS